MTWDQDFAQYLDLLPEGEEVVPIAGLRVLEWLDSEGQGHYAFATAGDLPKTSYVGFLETAKHDYLRAVDELFEDEP